jgi:hypothetical protein
METNNELNIYSWTYGDVSLLVLKQWVDSQIQEGKTKVELMLDWGYYNDVTDIYLKSLK